MAHEWRYGTPLHITEDYLYQEGMQKGQKTKERNVVIKMRKDRTLRIEKTAEFAEVTVEYVKQIEKELQK